MFRAAVRLCCASEKSVSQGMKTAAGLPELPPIPYRGEKKNLFMLCASLPYYGVGAKVLKPDWPASEDKYILLTRIQFKEKVSLSIRKWRTQCTQHVILHPSDIDQSTCNATNLQDETKGRAWGVVVQKGRVKGTAKRLRDTGKKSWHYIHQTLAQSDESAKLAGWHNALAMRLKGSGRRPRSGASSTGS